MKTTLQRWLIVGFALLAAGLACVNVSHSQSMLLTGAGKGAVGSAGCSQATTFLARTSGLDATHQNAYRTLICGLVSDGVWSKFDALWILATADATTASLNLVGTSFTLVAVGTPTFTVDTGYISPSAGNYVRTQFTPSTAGGLFTLNDAHLSGWNNINATSNTPLIGSSDTSAANQDEILAQNGGDNKIYARINSGNAGGVVISDARGLAQGNRTSSTVNQIYKNGVDQGAATVTSTALSSAEMIFPGGQDSPSGISFNTSQQIMAGSVGGAMTSTQAAAFYSRLHAYLVTVASISY